MEILIASCLLLTAMGLTMNFLSGYTKTSNRALAQTTLEQEQRSALSRIEKELTGASAVKSSYTDSGVSPAVTYTTGANTMVFEVPIYDASGFIITDAAGQQEVDTVVLEAVDDPDQKNRLKLRSSSTLARMLRVSVFPALDSNRQLLRNQVVLKHLMPKNTGDNNYSYPASLTSASAVPVFSYWDKNWNTVSSMDQAADIKLQLWNEQEYGRQQITAHKAFEIRLRNWKPSATPTP